MRERFSQKGRGRVTTASSMVVMDIMFLAFLGFVNPGPLHIYSDVLCPVVGAKAVHNVRDIMVHVNKLVVFLFETILFEYSAKN